MGRAKLTSLTDIFTFLRTNQTPIYSSMPAPFNLLGIDQWVGGFEFITYFDSFDGYHPRCFTPQETGPREFRSMEEVGNYLLSHKEVLDQIRSRGGGGKVLLIMFDEESERLVAELGLEMALPPAALRNHIDSKLVTTRLGNEAGVPSAPNTMGRADELRRVAGTRRRRRPRRRPRRADALRRFRPHHLLRQRARPTGTSTPTRCATRTSR